MGRSWEFFRNLWWRFRRRLLPPFHLTPGEWAILSRRLPVVVYQALADEQGTTLFAAGAIESMLGYTAAEWVGRPDAWYASLHPDDRAKVMQALARLTPGASVEISYRMRHKAGDWRWIRDTVTLFEAAPGRRYYLGVMTDVTHEKELEQATMESSVFLDELLRSGPWVLYRLEGPAQRIGYLSPNARNVLGLETEEVLGQTPEHLVERVHPEDRGLFRRHFALLRQAGGDQTRVRFRLESGEYHWIALHGRRAAGEPEVYLGYLMDVEEKARHEQWTRMNAERQRALYDLGRQAWETTQPERFFEKVVEVLDRILEPDYVSIMEHDSENRRMVVRAGKRVPVGTTFEVDRSQAGFTQKLNEVVVAHDLRSERRFPVPERLLEWGIRSTLSVPIPGLRSPYGVLGIGFRDPRRMDENTVRFVQQVAQLMGQVLRYRKVMDDLEFKAYHDDLTGLPNRRALYRHLSYLLSSAEVSGAVAFLDLVDFGEVNDTWGHETGDRLLRYVASRLQALAPIGVWAARWGGDEFVVVLVGDDPRALLEQALEHLSASAPLGEHRIRLSARAGMVRFRTFGSDAETLLRRADMALAVAKESKREVYEYEAGLQEKAAERRARVEALRRAMEDGEGGELYLHFQPVVNPEGRYVVAAEALLRWRDPRSGEQISPAEFVPLAEQYGLAVKLDARVLRMALGEGLRWLERWGEAAPRLSVNVSPESILDPAFTASLEELLQATGYPAERLTLEITERIIADVEHTRGPLTHLRELGVRIAVDDFGTGYSSLAYLAYLAVDILKVDRAFTRDIGKNPRTEAVLRSIFALGGNLGLQITIEGVEDVRQLEWLRQTECDWVQGFGIARPMQAQAFTRWLDDFLARNRAGNH
ncbi:sensor domain-containing protein [Oceanithermus desulfurans]|uniref:Diguanylate cyclase n=2 Tax=Oceanithermus desulfurans TaxID=227924 RepID=A0A511RNQ1_9DEIN|nr:GGDEF domain-containing phosphodiesterase [Oceanithermus desulfurans]MBB6030053.1 diguanylate cyclase (GGDEF)-like protein/PAS domain S-box-containing protein [Oceanithermus desulfurans]GEM90717.1 hypothetical protein ODE01S_21510 [Oceanithermus desulfurans NBRC 100063]